MGLLKRIDKPPDTYTGNQTEWDLLSAMQQYQQFHASRIREQKRISYMKNKAKHAVSTASYRRKNKESIAVTKKKNHTANALQQRVYRVKNNERIVANKKKYDTANAVQLRAYRVKNKDYIATCGKKYKNDNKEKIRKVGRLWYTKNYEEINTKNRTRTVKKREALYERIAVAVAASNNEIAERA